MAHLSDSGTAGGGGDDGFNPQEQPVLDDDAAPLSGNDKIAQQPDELEAKKKRILEEIESVLDKTQRNSPPNPSPTPNSVRPSLGLGIEVIDETALLDVVPSKTTTSKNGKQSKNGRRGGSKKNVTEEAKRNGKTKKKYTRKEMEALRYVNVGQQRKFWKALYATLVTVVAKEYDTLAATPHPPLPNKKPILSAEYCENRDRDSENVNPVGFSCSPSLIGKDGCPILEKCGEEDDNSEDDYSSIQRPAFLVEGEPNFDSGPPEDGWEYLRRVRWEADRIPQVKVVKLDRCKINKEQSAYMPKIPDIAKCPEHLLPLKQWEDVFLADFSALRANLTCLLETASAMNLDNPQPFQPSQPVGNNIGVSASVTDGDLLLCDHLSIRKTTDQPSNLTAEAKDSILPLETGSKASIDQTSSNCPTPPLLSAILRMDSVARISMLLKRITLLEPADTITRNDCMWLFALSATVDAPLHADTSAALRNLLRKCASLRAGKAELDEEVVMLNILATISGRYFGQSEN